MSFDTSRRALDDLPSIGDPMALRALAHPKRLALLHALSLKGELTASEASRLVGESPASCSFHFRQLAKHGFVEAAGEGPGRRRRWRRSSSGHRWDGPYTKPGAEIAAWELSRAVLRYEVGELLAWIDREPAEPPEWRDAAASIDNLAYLTVTELDELQTALTDVLYERVQRRYGVRVDDASQRPAGARPVRMFGFAFPVSPRLERD